VGTVDLAGEMNVLPLWRQHGRQALIDPEGLIRNPHVDSLQLLSSLFR